MRGTYNAIYLISDATQFAPVFISLSRWEIPSWIRGVGDRWPEAPAANTASPSSSGAMNYYRTSPFIIVIRLPTTQCLSPLLLCAQSRVTPLQRARFFFFGSSTTVLHSVSNVATTRVESIARRGSTTEGGEKERLFDGGNGGK